MSYVYARVLIFGVSIRQLLEILAFLENFLAYITPERQLTEALGWNSGVRTVGSRRLGWGRRKECGKASAPPTNQEKGPRKLFFLLFEMACFGEF